MRLLSQISLLVAEWILSISHYNSSYQVLRRIELLILLIPIWDIRLIIQRKAKFVVWEEIFITIYPVSCMNNLCMNNLGGATTFLLSKSIMYLIAYFSRFHRENQSEWTVYRINIPYSAKTAGSQINFENWRTVELMGNILKPLECIYSQQNLLCCLICTANKLMNVVPSTRAEECLSLYECLQWTVLTTFFSTGILKINCSIGFSSAANSNVSNGRRDGDRIDIVEVVLIIFDNTALCTTFFERSGVFWICGFICSAELCVCHRL